MKNKKIRKATAPSSGLLYGTMDYSKITNHEQLASLINTFLEALSMRDHKLKETHQYTMVLTDKYYNNYDEWLRVGFALHNTDRRLFLSWISFSAQSEKFSFKSWRKYPKN